MPANRQTNVSRSRIGRIGAYALHAQVADPVAHTAPARKAFLDRFERQVDPDGTLPQADRARRAEMAKKAYMLKLAHASAAARAARKAPRSAPRAGRSVDDGPQVA